MTRYPFFCTLLVACLFAGTAAGQGVVKGKVTDNKSLEPLSGVYVISQDNKVTVTDGDGNYVIGTSAGLKQLTFRFIGYKSTVQNIEVIPGDTVILNAEMEMELMEIGQIVVSANRSEQKVAELSVSMDILGAADFLNNHITDPQEIVNKTTGIEVMDGQASVRGGSGFSYGAGSRVLALIDGLPMVSPDAGNIKWQFLPLENLDQVEIIKGASSVLYGSSALNGIINFRSADPSSIPDTRFFAETGIFGNPRNINWKWWNSPRIFSAFSFSHLRKAGNTDIGVGASFLTDNGYRKYNDELLGRISLRLKHHSQKIRGLAYGINLNSGYTVKKDFVLWENASDGALKQDPSTVALLHGSFFAADPFISFNNHRKFRHDLRARLQFSGNRFPVRDQNNSDACSVYTEYQTGYRISDLLGLTAGITENYSSVLSNFYGNHTGLNIAGFTQLEINPLPRLRLVAGVRIEQNSLDRIKDKAVPIFRAGLNWQAADYTFVRASFGQGYRYPSIAEKYASTTIGAVKIYPNPFIESESGWSSETGIKQGIIIGEFKGQIDMSLFMSQNTNMIEYVFGNYPDPVTGVFDFGFLASNIEFSRVYGAESEFSISRKFGEAAVTITGGYTFIYPVEINKTTHKNTDIYLKYRRKHSALLGMNIMFRKFETGLNLYAKSKILRIDDVFLNELTREQILPGFYDYWKDHNTGYLLMDGNIGYGISKKIKLSFMVKNITNTEYMGRPGDIQPQRNYSIRLSGDF